MTNCISEPIRSSVIEYGLPIVLLTLLTCGIIYFLCKIHYQQQILNKKAYNQKIKKRKLGELAK